MGATEEILETLRHKFDKVYLFGSRARGDHLKESDIDIIVVDDIFQHMPYGERIATVRRAIKNVLERYPVDVDVIAVTKEEFSKLSKRRTNIIGYIVHRGEIVEA